MTETITPHRAKVLRASARESYSWARECLARARELRADGGIIAMEDAAGEVDMARVWREKARADVRRLRLARVEKYANISPRAKARRAVG